MHVEAEALIADLRSAGVRITGARRAICDVLAQSHGDHLSAADIHTRAQTEHGATIDPSTVYRTLDVLERSGLLHHVHLGHGPGVVHLTDETNHHHLACESCGSTVDVPLSDFRPLFSDIYERHGFRVAPAHFAIVGRCRTCEQSENTSAE